MTTEDTENDEPTNSRGLKFHAVWLSIGWILVSIVITLSLWPDPPTPDTDIPGIDKIGHFVAYFVLMSWFGFIYLREVHLWIGVRLLLLGITLEFLQWLFGHRFFEIGDILVNSTGIAVAWVLGATRFSQTLQWTEQDALH